MNMLRIQTKLVFVLDYKKTAFQKTLSMKTREGIKLLWKILNVWCFFFFFLLVVVELPDEPDGKRFELFFEREGQVEASTQTMRPITVNVKPLLKEHLLDLFKKNTYHKTVCRTCAESFSFLF